MTTQFLDPRDAAPSTPAPRILIGGALIGALGAMSFSLAIGSFVVGSTHRLQPSSAVEAATLVGATPTFVVAGLLHLAIAAALVAGGRRLRAAAVAAAAIAAIVAIGAAVMLLIGFDPTGGARAGHPTTDGVAVLLIAAAMYAGAALIAGPVPADD
jgi:hypothetical protein